MSKKFERLHKKCKKIMPHEINRMALKKGTKRPKDSDPPVVILKYKMMFCAL